MVYSSPWHSFRGLAPLHVICIFGIITSRSIFCMILADCDDTDPAGDYEGCGLSVVGLGLRYLHSILGLPP